MLGTGIRETGSHRGYRFGDFTLDLERGSLESDGRLVKLRPKSFAVLRFLVEHAGKLVSKREILDAVWRHPYVSEASLTQCLIDIRRVLGDDDHEIIRTVPRRGYVFEAEVRSVGRGEFPAVQDPAALDVGSPTGLSPGSNSPVRTWLLLLLLVVAGGWLVAQLGGDLTYVPGGAADRVEYSIAVLPFADMSPGQDQAHFADGMSEELLNVLAGVPGLRVIARTSSFALRDENIDIPTIARRLNVAYVLEGSVRRSGNEVRITAQLVDAASNTHIWSKTFDRRLKNVFAVQSEIAGLVADSLRLTLGEDRRQVLTRPPDPEAFEHYLQGQYFWNRRGQGDVDRAESEFRRSVEIDPELARAWVGLAGVYNLRVREEMIPQPEGLTLYRDAILRALALAPDSADAHVRASSYFWLMGDAERSVHHWEKAQALEPDNLLIMGFSAGMAMSMGQYVDAVEIQRRIVQRDPLVAVSRGNLGSFLLAAGRFDEAEVELEMALRLNAGFDNDPANVDISTDLAAIRMLTGRSGEALAIIEGLPDVPLKHQYLAMLLWGTERQAEADAALAKLRTDRGLWTLMLLAEVHAFRGDFEQSFEFLENLIERADLAPLSPDRTIMMRVARSVLLMPLRQDPRWKALLAEYEESIIWMASA